MRTIAISFFAIVVFAGVLPINGAVVIAGSPEESQRPNVVVILTDDQGWGDLSCHGNQNLATPHLDSLARDGVSFENFYVCAVCAPTRAEFLTGRYYPRTGVSGVSLGQERLNPEETTIAEVFKDAGYLTGAFGKWHNGTQSPYHPNNQGFDEFYGFTSGHWGHYYSPPLDHNGRIVRGEGFVVDDFTNRAIRFIEAASHSSKPFFCYLPINTPHAPMMVDDRYYSKFENLDPNPAHREPEKEDVMMTRAALAMVENIDWNVGRLLAKLNELRLDERTIVIFFSDNGPNSYRWNGGMKGKKGSIDEGGLRSPLLMRWKGKISPATKVTQIAGSIDLLPTLVSLASVSLSSNRRLDGIDLSAPILGEDVSPPNRSLYSVMRDRVSVRSQRFRLDAKGQLFDIKNDRGQTRDVALRHPEQLRLLKEQQKAFSLLAKREFERYKNRPFLVGYAGSTILPARDGTCHGSIRRSVKSPNNSFFTQWSGEDGYIRWRTDVLRSATYRVIVNYTCRTEDVGVKLAIRAIRKEATPDTSQQRTQTESVATATVVQAFDPPLYDKSRERVANSHYFVKDFRPLELGSLDLKAGKTEFRLTASEFTGERAVDVHSIHLIRD
ncbi:MAG: arylsulfatase [Planctomycetota bacterium]